MVLCSPDWGAYGGNEYWRTLLDRLTVASVQLPDEAIYVPLGRKTRIGKPGWGSILSVVDGGLTAIFFRGGAWWFPAQFVSTLFLIFVRGGSYRGCALQIHHGPLCLHSNIQVNRWV